MVGFKEKLGKRITVTAALPYVNGVKHLGNITGSILPADIFHRFLDVMGIDNVFICGTDDHGTPAELGAKEEGLPPKEYVKKYYKIQKEIYEKWNFDFTFFGKTSSDENRKLAQDIFLSILENGYILKEKVTLPYCRQCKRFLPDRYITGTCPHCGYDKARGDQCEKCGKVLDPIDLENKRCAVCREQDIEFREEKHLFINFPLLQKKLEEWIKQSEHWPEGTRNFALSWLREGLKPRGITRNLEWGIPVPLKDYEHLTLYIWFEAPIGYISITQEAEKNKKIKNWKPYWKDSKIYHFIGKDNIPFHTIFWPGFLLGAIDSEERDTNFLLPHNVVGYEYLNWQGEKFSTSLGNGLFSDEALDLFPADYWRFYLASVLPETKDSNFDWDDFAAKINNELIANYGNLFYRVTSFIKENFDGVVPEGKIGDKEKELLLEITHTKEDVEASIAKVKLREALQNIMGLAAKTNKYFQDKKPWAAGEEDKKTTVYTAINSLRAITILLWPFVPETAEKALQALGEKEKKFAEIDELKIPAGRAVTAAMLFKKVEKEELDKAKKYRTKYAKISKEKEGKRKGGSEGKDRGNKGSKRESKENKSKGKKGEDEGKRRKESKGKERRSREGRGKEKGKSGVKTKETDPGDDRIVGIVTFKDFQKVEMVVGTVLSVEDHPDAEKLYVMKVDLGPEKRQLVAGLKGIYEKEELEGKQIIVVKNLEQKELRGVKSEGMLLATEEGTLIMPEKEAKNGSRIM